jgi:hypothetical protein
MDAAGKELELWQASAIHLISPGVHTQYTAGGMEQGVQLWRSCGAVLTLPFVCSCLTHVPAHLINTSNNLAHQADQLTHPAQKRARMSLVHWGKQLPLHSALLKGRRIAVAYVQAVLLLHWPVPAVLSAETHQPGAKPAQSNHAHAACPLFTCCQLIMQWLLLFAWCCSLTGHWQPVQPV